MTLEICIIAFTNMKLAFAPCPLPPVAERMECRVQAMSEYAASMYAVCIDPKTKTIVYAGKVSRVQET